MLSLLEKRTEEGRRAWLKQQHVAQSKLQIAELAEWGAHSSLKLFHEKQKTINDLDARWRELTRHKSPPAHIKPPPPSPPPVVRIPRVEPSSRLWKRLGIKLQNKGEPVGEGAQGGATAEHRLFPEVEESEDGRPKDRSDLDKTYKLVAQLSRKGPHREEGRVPGTAARPREPTLNSKSVLRQYRHEESRAEPQSLEKLQLAGISEESRMEPQESLSETQELLQQTRPHMVHNKRPAKPAKIVASHQKQDDRPDNERVSLILDDRDAERIKKMQLALSREALAEEQIKKKRPGQPVPEPIQEPKVQTRSWADNYGTLETNLL
ncbi:hypothetical protein CYMTET_24808 [Cymbomonas tetramitiformis]|uniref:Uncharacterized protein n=1 Tax=Cymbomonas tetramitiformis TaxID=36881 RepID=A0AAE0FVU9_9CHLO|nr:hypothetical protein CYMTET_24808 [Cymbomonas tetramitiformis]